MEHANVCWVREITPGRFALTLGGVVPSTELPRGTPIPPKGVELHLPAMSYRTFRKAAETVAGLAFREDRGRLRPIMPPAEATRHDASLLLAALAQSRMPRRIDQPAPTVGFVLRADGIDLAGREILRWRGLPREASRGFFAPAAAMSAALQELLRASILEAALQVVRAAPPVTSTADESKLGRTVYPALVYALTRVFRGRPRTDFTPDFRGQGALARMCHGLRPRLAELLEPVARGLAAAGKPREARLLAADRAASILFEALRDPRGLVHLLHSEAALVNASVTLAARAGEIAAGCANPVPAALGGAALYARSVHAALRGMTPAPDAAELAPRLLMETVRSLADALSPDARPALSQPAGGLEAAGAAGRTARHTALDAAA